MDDNFSPRVQDVIVYSKEEAIRLHHDYIGTEHLLLGILRKGNGTAIQILNAIDMDISFLRRKMEGLSPSNTDFDYNPLKRIHLTTQADKALKTTFLEAKFFKSEKISTAHLLLCIIRNENDPTSKLLQKFELDYSKAKEIYIELFSNNSAPKNFDFPKMESTNEGSEEDAKTPFEKPLKKKYFKI